MLEEARKRSDKTFVLGNEEHLEIEDSAFDAIFTVTTLEFLDDYQMAVKEIARITKPSGKFLSMILNPKSEYFKQEIQKNGDYFKKIKHTNLKKIRNYISQFYQITNENYFLGFRRQQIFETNDKKFATLYVVIGIKK